MQLRKIAKTFLIITLLCTLGMKAQADQLPDLRGKTFFLTGLMLVTGSVFGQSVESAFPYGIHIEDGEPPAKIIINATGSEDNQNLTGVLQLPIFPNSVDGYPTCPGNPAFPLTASFNRTTGEMIINGSKRWT